MTDALNLKPGNQLTDEEKVKLAKANADASAEAYRLADEQRTREVQSGRVELPVAQSVAESIKQKLQREEFQKHE